MNGRSPRRKGSRLERLVVQRFRAAGLQARRVPLSGSARDFPGDVQVQLPGLGDILIEVKARKTSPLYAWIDGRGAVVVKADWREPLIVMRLSDFLKALEPHDFRPPEQPIITAVSPGSAFILHDQDGK